MKKINIRWTTVNIPIVDIMSRPVNNDDDIDNNIIIYDMRDFSDCGDDSDFVDDNLSDNESDHKLSDIESDYNLSEEESSDESHNVNNFMSDDAYDVIHDAYDVIHDACDFGSSEKESSDESDDDYIFNDDDDDDDDDIDDEFYTDKNKVTQLRNYPNNTMSKILSNELKYSKIA